ncbi:MAG: DUF4129 domain-containing protein, partial [Dehalococcoidia bacterium]|nr:DUF4129 domain-containing protein [Dehalococcoidia bacterium]
GPPPSLPALPELLRPQEVLAALPIPDWLFQGLAVLAGGALLVLLARLVARSVRRMRHGTGAPAASEARERIPLDRTQLLPRWRRQRQLGPALRRGIARPHDVRSAYRAALALLAARGLTRRPGETPLAFARRVAQSLPHVLPAFTDLTGRYLLARYAERETPDDRSAALADWQELKQRLSARE